jgi:hypothetical protein
MEYSVLSSTKWIICLDPKRTIQLMPSKVSVSPRTGSRCWGSLLADWFSKKLCSGGALPVVRKNLIPSISSRVIASRCPLLVVPTNESVLVERMDLGPQGRAVTDLC